MGSHQSKENIKEIIELAKNGDANSFGHLYELYFTPVFRYVYCRVKNKQEAEDLAQNVFLKVYQNIENYQERNKSPLAYFFTVARNTIIDHWRKKKDTSKNSEEFLMKIPDYTNNPDEIARKKETSQIIHQVIKQLTEDQQNVIIMKFISGLSNKEIAETLNKSEEAVRQLQCRSLKIMCQILEKQIYEYK